MTQLPGGGDIVVAGYRNEDGVNKRWLVKLSLGDGSVGWATSAFGDSSGSNGAFETIDLTSSGDAVLLGGFAGKPTASEYYFRSYGNTAGGQAVVMKIPVSALTGFTPPTSASASWSTTFPAQMSVKAVRGLSSGVSKQ